MSWEDIGELALWPNKEKSGNQPDVRGHIMIDGHKYPISAWRSKSDNPNAPTYWGKMQRDTEKQPKLVLVTEDKPPPQQGAYPPGSEPKQQELEPDDEFDDDIPF